MEVPPGASVPPPSPPPEDDVASQHMHKKSKTTKRSFADTVSAPSQSFDDVPVIPDTLDWAFEDPVIELDTEMDDQETPDGCPRVKLSKELRTELCRPWKMALIVKYLGKSINFNVLKQRLPGIWNLQGRLDFIDIGYGFFVARFSNTVDYMHVLLDGPWKIFDNYLVIQRWQPEFDPLTAKLTKMAVWVRIPRLPVEYFREDVIKSVLENVRDKHRAVEYEGLHVVCFNCGTVGHREQVCPHTVTTAAEPNEGGLNNTPTGEKEGEAEHTSGVSGPANSPPVRKYGSWMLVTRKDALPDRRNNNKQTNQNTQSKSPRRNSFDVLQHADGEMNDDAVPTPGRNNLDQTRRGKATANRPTTVPTNAKPSNSTSLPPESVPSLPNMNDSSQPRPTQPTGSRGSRHSHGRGANRRGGRGSRGPPLNFNVADVWMEKTGNSGIFHFGNGQVNQISPDQTSVAPHGTDTVMDSTPGDGGCQTSPPVAVSS
ncbi:uncharacterized protein LOC116020253 [Ipomoea triloba]|uniref:uncharacterized protein LOC116020253 n=1 Tax=Ipomoea triloba TaxID=35885 RepID=UPI00125DEFA3|nr:uncharacterized protein LOC116020253 [Ipomoea triloba]